MAEDVSSIIKYYVIRVFLNFHKNDLMECTCVGNILWIYDA